MDTNTYTHTRTHRSHVSIVLNHTDRERERRTDAKNGKGMSGDIDTHTTTMVAWFQTTKTDGCIQAWMEGCKQLQRNKRIQTHTHAHTRFQNAQRYGCIQPWIDICNKWEMQAWMQTHTHAEFTCVHGFELHRQRERDGLVQTMTKVLVEMWTHTQPKWWHGFKTQRQMDAYKYG